MKTTTVLVAAATIGHAAATVSPRPSTHLHNPH